MDVVESKGLDVARSHYRKWLPGDIVDKIIEKDLGYDLATGKRGDGTYTDFDQKIVDGVKEYGSVEEACKRLAIRRGNRVVLDLAVKRLGLNNG